MSACTIHVWQALLAPEAFTRPISFCGRKIAPSSAVTAHGSGSALAEDEEGPPGYVRRRDANKRAAVQARSTQAKQIKLVTFLVWDPLCWGINCRKWLFAQYQSLDGNVRNVGVEIRIPNGPYIPVQRGVQKKVLNQYCRYVTTAAVMTSTD